MEGLKEWLLGLIGMSVLCAAAESLMPPGGVKRVGKLACGLALMWVMLRPVTALRGFSIEELLTDWTRGVQEQGEQLEQQSALTRKTVIEEHFAAYISDKGASLGVPCRVEVDCALQEEGVYLPVSARLWGDFDDVTQSRLTGLLSGELGIPAQRQTYYLTKEEGA